jgi:hypothetical protein
VVTWPTGAIVPALTLRVTQLDTAIQFSSQSNDSGYFWFRVIQVGKYDLVAVQAGFGEQTLSVQRMGKTLEEGRKASQARSA